MQNIIELEKVSVYYGNICALSNINLIVKKGDFLAIIGPNGGGKSTLLKVILGINKNYRGKIRIFGKSPENITGSIGYVPQYLNFDKNFPIRVIDVILMGRIVKKKFFFQRYSKEDIEHVYELMEKLDISHLSKRQIGQLSGGQLQRVLIARALALEPKILLLDEPTASLDAKSKTSIYQILKKLNENITIILVTHDMAVIPSYVKNIACLNTKLYYHGEPKLEEIILRKAYGCPVELIAHGKIPHRVLQEHKEEFYNA